MCFKCFKDDGGEESSDPAPRPSQGRAYHGHSSGGRQNAGQDDRDHHEQRHNPHNVSNALIPPSSSAPTTDLAPPAMATPPATAPPPSTTVQPPPTLAQPPPTMALTLPTMALTLPTVALTLPTVALTLPTVALTLPTMALPPFSAAPPPPSSAPTTDPAPPAMATPPATAPPPSTTVPPPPTLAQPPPTMAPTLPTMALPPFSAAPPPPSSAPTTDPAPPAMATPPSTTAQPPPALAQPPPTMAPTLPTMALPPFSAAPPPPPAPPLPPPSSAAVSKDSSSSIRRVTKFVPGESNSPSSPSVICTTDAIARCLRNSGIHWAVIGGASCVLLGSARATRDVDIVVSRPEHVRQLKNLLRAGDQSFTIEPRTRHTYFNHEEYDPIEIEVLCHPSTFKVTFNAETEVLDVNGVYLLNLAAMLDSKCVSVFQRPSDEKRRSDAQDIIFILSLAMERGMRFDRNGVPNATEEIQNALDQNWGVKELFQAVGL